ncbi:MAG: hypothetical protein AB7U82_03395 [Blastocatellales bacterium]
MRTSKKLVSALLTLLTLALVSGAAIAADPGLTYPPTSEVSDQKAGSVLFYNIYTSGATNGNDQNTRINITNTSSTSAAFVHLFFVADNCSVADLFICLTANQTATFLASDVDPGVSGYLVAVASDGVFGCPTSFNFLIGDEYVKFATGHNANLGAEAFAALYTGVLPGCDANSVTATLNFNGLAGGYNRVPRVLALSNFASRVDGNDTLLIINRVGGNLGTGASTIGAIFGLLYDDLENVRSFTFTAGVCQFRGSLSNTFPRIVPRLETFIPSGRSGWLRFWAAADIGLLGAAINNNSYNDNHEAAFNGGHNLHKLTLTNTATYVIPIFPPSC